MTALPAPPAPPAPPASPDDRPHRPLLGALPPVLRGTVALLLLVLNTLWWCSLLFVLALVRLALPWGAVRRVLDPLLNAIATAWVAGNSAWMRWTQGTTWNVAGLDGLSARQWYLVVANHQSWVDIFVLQHLLNRRIPLLKFFLKRELLYVPVLGLAWWALDFPFMRRHSDEELRRNPAKRLQDMQAARAACERFAHAPTSVMNFVEGTRFSAEKQAARGGKLQHLLPPKAGGLAMAVAVLGPRLDALLDATLVYPEGVPTFWQFLCGEVPRIVVRVQRCELPTTMRCEGGELDPALRRQVSRWLTELWQAKDERIGALLRELK